MKLFLALLLTAMGVTAKAQSNIFDISAVQSQFESRVTEHLRATFDPLLGKDNYSVTVHSEMTPDPEFEASTYLPKLGVNATPVGTGLPMSVQVDKWVKSLDVDLSYSEALDNVNKKDLQARVEATLKHFGKYTKHVNVASFVPIALHKEVKEKQFWAELPTTSIAILIFGMLVCLLGVWSTVRISRIKFSSEVTGGGGMSYASPAPSMGGASAGASLGGGSINLGGDGMVVSTMSTHVDYDGISRWQQWIQEDPLAARHFVEKLGRSNEERDLQLLSHVMHSTDLKLLRVALSEIDKDALALIKAAVDHDVPLSLRPKLDLNLSQAITQACIDMQLDSENILKWIHDFTMEECVHAAEKDFGAVSLFMRVLSTSQVEQIMNRMSKDRFDEFLAKPEGQSIDFAKIAERAHKHIEALRKESTKEKTKSLSRWMLVAANLDADREEAFYRKVAQWGSADEMQSLGAENFPQFLVEHLPHALLKPVLNSYAFQERASLLSSFNEDQRKLWLSQYERETRVKEILELELENIATDTERKRAVDSDAARMHRDYLARVRKHLCASPENQAAAKDVLGAWLKDQKEGSNVRAA